MDKKHGWLSQLFGTTRDQGPAAPPTGARATQGSAHAADPAATSVGTQVPPCESAEVVWTPGQTLLDDFVVERELGEGGMGKVYLVRSRATGQPFAVKKAKFRDETSRRNFLGELQAWIDLPEHPHLAACRFFRTIGDEVVIFGEYVDGGSLAALIRGRGLTGLEQVLDVAIQFAWGLHAAHEAGLIHQDAKPGNVLLTADGRVKIADFGLARARARAGEGSLACGQSILVSWGGMTPAYCSPEQAAGHRLSRRTDVWSWGVSLLELFTGQTTWERGTQAPQALEAYLAGGGAASRQPRMPAALIDVLRTCFRPDPAGRWQTLAEAAEALRAVYATTIGRPHPRSMPAPRSAGARPAPVQDRWTPFGGPRADPRAWLQKALHEAGRNVSEAEALLPAQTGTRAAQVVAELAVCEEAAHIFERLIASGRKDLEAAFVELCFDKALVHRIAEDIPAALALYDRANELCERLIYLERRQDLAGSLAAGYQAKAQLLVDRGERAAALSLYDQAIVVRQRLAEEACGPEPGGELARAYLSKARALAEPGQALALYDRAIALLERLAEQDDISLTNLLGRAYVGKARVLSERGDQGSRSHRGRCDDLADTRAALTLYDQAIALYQRPETREGRRELANDLAATFASKARALGQLGDVRAAVAFYNRAILLYKRLVDLEGRRELANEYAEACTRKADAVAELGDHRLAGRFYDRAIALLERVVNQEGRRERSADLARAYLGRADVFQDLGDRPLALPRYGQAVAILERLVQQEGQSEDTADLIRAWLGKAHALAGLSDRGAAVSFFDRAIALLERQVQESGQNEQAHELAAAYCGKAKALAAAGDLTAAVGLYDQAIAGWERLVRQAGRRKPLRHLAKAKAVRAAFLLKLGHRDAAAAAAREAVALLQAEIARTGRTDLKRTLKWAANALQQVL